MKNPSWSPSFSIYVYILLFVLAVMTIIFALYNNLVLGSIVIFFLYVVAISILLSIFRKPSPQSKSSSTTDAPYISNELFSTFAGLLLLLFVSITFQATSEYHQRVFARETILHGDQADLLVNYPHQLLHELPNQRGLPLRLRLQPVTSTPALTSTATLTNPTSTPTVTTANGAVPECDPSLISTLPFTTTLLPTLPAPSAAATSSPPASAVIAQSALVTYTVYIYADSPLIFSDGDGKEIQPRVDLSISANGSAQQTLYIRSGHIADYAGQLVELCFLIAPASPGSTPKFARGDAVRMSTESSYIAPLRLGISRLFGDFTIPLGIAVAVTGWMLQRREAARAEERQRLEKAQAEEEKAQAEERQRLERMQAEQRELAKAQQEQEYRRIKEIRGLISTNLPEAILRHIEIRKQYPQTASPTSNNLPEAHQQELNDITELLNAKKTPQDAEQLILDAGDHLKHGQYTLANDTLDAIYLHFDTSSFDELRNAISTIKDTFSNKSVDIQATIDSIRYLRSAYSSIHREICVQTLLMLYTYLNKESNNQKLCAEFQQIVESEPNSAEPDVVEPDVVELDAVEPDAVEPDTVESEANREKDLTGLWSLLRDQRLLAVMPQELKQLKERLTVPQQGHLKVSWFPYLRNPQHPPIPISDRVRKWLKQYEFVDISRLRSLDISEEEASKEIFASLLLPSLEEPKHMIVGEDLFVIRTGLAAGLYENAHREPRAFPIEIALPLSTHASPTTPSSLLATLAQAASDRWLRLLQRKPNYFYELSSVEQDSMAMLLAQRLGSFEMLSLALEQGQPTDDADRRMLLHDLEVAFKRSKPSVRQTHHDLVGWLRLRPRAILHTFLLVGCLDRSSAVKEQIAQLFHLVPILNDAQVYIKLFAPPEVIAAHPHLQEFAMRLPEQELLDNLDLILMDRKGRTTTNFINVIDHTRSQEERQQILEQIAHDAEGSLSRFLWLIEEWIWRYTNDSNSTP